MRTTVIIAVLASVIVAASAIKCFNCNNCGDEAGTPHECSSTYDTCVKISVAGLVEKRCAKKEVCGYGAVERGVVSVWNKFKKLINDIDQDTLKFSDTSDAQLIYCCDKDYCNSSNRVSGSLVVLLFPLLARWLLC